MPPPIYTSKQSSPIQQRAQMCLNAVDFSIIGTGAALTRGGKGNYYWGISPNSALEFVSNIKVPLRNYASSVVKYNQTGLTNNAPISINSVTVSYLIAGGALSLGTFGISQTDYPVTGIVGTPTVGDLLAPTSVALGATGGNITSYTITPTNPALLPNSSSELLAEFLVTTPNGVGMNFYGAVVNFMYNV